MAFSDHFVGVAQSRWTGYAILAAVIAVALSILFGKEQIPLGRRVFVIFILFLLALPTIVLVLFQINCMVSGTSKGPYCGWYAWIVAAFTILYCILLIIVAVTAKSYEAKVEKEHAEKFAVNFDQANKYAGSMMQALGMEGFEDVPKEPAAEAAKPTTSTTSTTTVKPITSVAAESGTSSKKEKKPEENKEAPAETFVGKVAKFANGPKAKFTDGPEDKKQKESFADYSYGAAPVGESANMYML